MAKKTNSDVNLDPNEDFITIPEYTEFYIVIGVKKEQDIMVSEIFRDKQKADDKKREYEEITPYSYIYTRNIKTEVSLMFPKSTILFIAISVKNKQEIMVSEIFREKKKADDKKRNYQKVKANHSYIYSRSIEN